MITLGHFHRQSSLEDNIEEASSGGEGSAANSQRSLEVVYAGAGGRSSQPEPVKVGQAMAIVAPLGDLLAPDLMQDIPAWSSPDLPHLIDLQIWQSVGRWRGADQKTENFSDVLFTIERRAFCGNIFMFIPGSLYKIEFIQTWLVKWDLFLFWNKFKQPLQSKNMSNTTRNPSRNSNTSNETCDTPLSCRSQGLVFSYPRQTFHYTFPTTENVREYQSLAGAGGGSTTVKTAKLNK